MLQILSIITIVQVLILSSCSSADKSRKVAQKNEVHTEQNDQDLSSEISQKDELLQDPAIMGDEQLEKLVNSVKDASPDQVEYVANDLFIKGTDLSMRGESLIAARYYKYLTQLKPDDLYVKKKYAVELIRSGNLEESITILELVFKSQSKPEVSSGLILAGVYTALEKKKEAQKIYSHLLKSNPKSEESCVFLAKSYAAEKKFKKADRLLAKCQARLPKSAIFPYYRGKIALNQENEDKALNYFKKSLGIDQQYHQAALGIGIIYESRGRYKRALKQYEKFLEASPMNYPVLTRVVQLKFQIKDYEQIIDYAERLISIDPTDLNLKVQLGILYSDKKRFDDAKGIFREILVEVPDSDKVLFYLGALYKETSNFEDAIVYFSKITTDSPLYFDSSVQMAQLLQSLIQMGRKDKRDDFMELVSQRSEVSPNLKFKLGIMLTTFFEEENNYQKAIETLEALNQEESYDNNHDYYLASLYDKKGNFNMARQLIEKILEDNPEDAHALNFLGYSLLERNEEMDLAYRSIKKAVKLMPEDGYIRDSLGWYYYNIGEYELAIKELKKAWQLVGEDYIIAKHLAMAYEKMNKLEQAKELYEEAIKLCQVEKERELIVEILTNLEKRRLPASQ